MSGSPPDDRCGYVYPPNHEVGDKPANQNCCWRKAAESEETEKCLWHANPDNVEKTVVSLRKARITHGQTDQQIPDFRDQISPKVELLDGVKMHGIKFGKELPFRNVSLREADLLDTDLRDADLSGANLSGADFSDTDFWGADLSDADLLGANLSGADLLGADLSDANLRDASLPDANLREANLTAVNLYKADLPDANLRDADLSNKDLLGADLSDAFLFDADLSGTSLLSADLSDADLRGVDLSDADLSGADLSGADLSGADLSDADLRNATLTGAILRETTIEDASIDGSTICQSLAEGYDADRRIKTRYIRQVVKTRPRWWPSVGSSDLDASQWDATARAYHDLKFAFNDHGLVSKAWQQHLRERGARRCEARVAGEKGRWLRSLIAWQLTGYGVSIRRILRNMSIVFGIATLAYLSVELMYPDHAINEEYANIPEILYYSVITFTTTPPAVPDSTVIKAIVMTEAFLGTLLVVFLGYVLGTREQF